MSESDLFGLFDCCFGCPGPESSVDPYVTSVFHIGVFVALVAYSAARLLQFGTEKGETAGVASCRGL